MESSSKATGTKTQEEQWMVENDVGQIYSCFSSIPPNAQSVFLEIRRDNHIQYLMHGLNNLGPPFSTLDANRPWICYWILHSIALLGDSLDEELEHSTIEFLSRCQDPDGGYGGGPGQMPHLATTYAAVNSLITLGGPKSLSSINRGKLRAFLLRMKDASGGFRMHDGGEVDVRACYTAISTANSFGLPVDDNVHWQILGDILSLVKYSQQVASVLNILDDELTQNVGDYILSCQTYEGGIAGEPGSEAHGGYTFCGLAAMVLINEVHRLDMPCLIDWVVFRQGVEGGFQGRTNKLVDGCYSFWQGGVAVIVQQLHSVICEQLGLSKALDSECDSESYHDYETSDISDVEECTVETSFPLGGTCHHRKEVSFADIGVDFISNKKAIAPIFSSMHLQQYLLLCSQQGAGFRDKPGKPRDHYHTCYCLSGLSVCQYCSSADANSPPLARDILGPYSNLLEQLHPLYNLVLDRYHEAQEFFSKF